VVNNVVSTACDFIFIIMVDSSSVHKITINYCRRKRHKIAHNEIVTVDTSISFIILLLRLSVNVTLLHQFMSY